MGRSRKSRCGLFHELESNLYRDLTRGRILLTASSTLMGHRCRVLSEVADSSARPSGRQARCVTSWLSLLSVAQLWPEGMSHTVIPRSACVLLIARRALSGLNASTVAFSGGDLIVLAVA